MIRRSDRESVQSILQDAMRPMGAKVVAADLGHDGVPYSTLMSELNPSDDTHKLGLFRVLEILDVTGVAGPFLRWLAGRYGYAVVKTTGGKLNGESARSALLRVAEDLGEASCLVRKATQASSDYGVEISPNEAQAILPAAERLVSEAYGLLAGLQSLKHSEREVA